MRNELVVADESTYFVYNTPLGRLTIASNGSAITHVLFGEHQLAGERRATALTNLASNQLQEFLAGRRKEFDLPLEPEGTDFQKQVWSALRKIPYGQTRSYAQLAQSIGSPKAARAVGMANNRNPICIIVPCHRVVGANGKLVGYAAGFHIKKWLLELESKHC